MITLGNEIIRINPYKNTIEFSTNQGRLWNYRYGNTSYGVFRDLLVYKSELLANISQGLLFSTNADRSWDHRY